MIHHVEQDEENQVVHKWQDCKELGAVRTEFTSCWPPLICNLYLTHFLSSKRPTTAEVQDQDPLALGCFPARPVWTSRRPCAGHARQAGASSHFGQLTQMIASMRLLGQLALCSFSQNTNWHVRLGSVQKEVGIHLKEAQIMRFIRARNIWHPAKSFVHQTCCFRQKSTTQPIYKRLGTSAAACTSFLARSL